MSKNVLSKTEIKVTEKGLGSPTSSFINEADLQRDFEMRCKKWDASGILRNETQNIPFEVSTYKSTWNPTKGSPALELFLSNGKEDILQFCLDILKNLIWIGKSTSLCGLCRNAIIKPTDNSSAGSLVVWDRQDYLKDIKRQFGDSSIYKEVKVTENNFVDLVDKNKIFVQLERRNIIQGREKK